jgi:molybdenum cofactor biosynthesis enzyme MoaA
MKLYVLPVEKKCNAKCGFCITKVRERTGILCARDYLKVRDLKSSLEQIPATKIEITGGGEPTLHPRIEEIIDICCNKAKTQMYTNGSLASRIKNLERLDRLCVSRAHYSDSHNERIMGISYNFRDLLERAPPIKLSLMLCRQGINDNWGFMNYLDWASNLASQVVVREMFNLNYGKVKSQYVSIVEFFQGLGMKADRYSGRNPIVKRGSLEVEFEFPEMTLHADGKIRRGWRDEI